MPDEVDLSRDYFFAAFFLRLMPCFPTDLIFMTPPPGSDESKTKFLLCKQASIFTVLIFPEPQKKSAIVDAMLNFTQCVR